MSQIIQQILDVSGAKKQKKGEPSQKFFRRLVILAQEFNDTQWESLDEACQGWINTAAKAINLKEEMTFPEGWEEPSSAPKKGSQAPSTAKEEDKAKQSEKKADPVDPPPPSTPAPETKDGGSEPAPKATDAAGLKKRGAGPLIRVELLERMFSGTFNKDQKAEIVATIHEKGFACTESSVEMAIYEITNTVRALKTLGTTDVAQIEGI